MGVRSGAKREEAVEVGSEPLEFTKELEKADDVDEEAEEKGKRVGVRLVEVAAGKPNPRGLKLEEGEETGTKVEAGEEGTEEGYEVPGCDD